MPIKKKKKYYNIKRMRSVDARYKALLGERSNGKSFAVKYICLEDAEKEEYFVYLRRWEVDTKTEDVISYFADLWENDENVNYIEKITKKAYNYIDVKSKVIYFATIDNEGKITRGKRIGKVVYLTGAEHFKSQQFPKTTNIIFEEFVTTEGYLKEEPHKLMHLVSTIFRRRKGTVWLIGNTITRVCPYFWEWNLKHVRKQELGTIELYKQLKPDGSYEDENDKYVTIAVELCDTVTNENTMFFGEKSESIVNGVWESDIQPKLQKKLNKYKIMYTVILEHEGFDFSINVIKDLETNYLQLYVYPHTGKRKTRRIITNRYSDDPLITPRLTKICGGDEYVKYLVENKKVVFSDNLTGSDFWYILKLRGGL